MSEIADAMTSSMKVVILAGGLGTRLAEETHAKPKALVEIGGKPVLWHIMMYYAHYGLRDFVIALGYKGDAIRKYFADAADDCACRGDDLMHSSPAGSQTATESGWNVALVDTGSDTETGGRVKRLAPYLEGRTFMLTWCDGLADVDLRALLNFHQSHGRLATLTAVYPPPRFGRLTLDGDRVTEFNEKVITEDDRINGAFFVLEPSVFDYIDGDHSSFERGPLVRLAEDGQLMAYRHDSFWQCMDTLHEARSLNSLWASGSAPWKIWR